MVTDQYRLIGAPVAHSLSPVMHNYWFRSLEISAYYQADLVTRDELEQAVMQIRASGIKGFNVTFPHKKSILLLLDELSERARLIGAVNTVVCAGSRLIGYNTDGVGFLQGLFHHFPNLAQKQHLSVLMIGAGGAAYSVAQILSETIAERIDICNRTMEKAFHLSAACGASVLSDALTFAQAEQHLDQYQIVINTTSVGLMPEQDHLLIRLDHACRHTVFVDLIYQPRRTALLKEAERHGFPVLNGLSMLVYQGALAFQMWTQLVPDSRSMESYLENNYLS
nr:shikimate dehydrogenase [Sporolactobacillus mangiferae]